MKKDISDALELTENAAENAEAALDILEHHVDNVITVTKNNPIALAGFFVVGLAIGGVVAYKIAEQRVTLKYEDIMTQEMEKARTFYMKLAKSGEFESPESAVETLVPEDVVEAVRSYQGREKTPYNRPEDVVVVEETEEVVKYYNSDTFEPEERKGAVEERNVFVDSASDPQDWDYDVEKKIREQNPDDPYVVSFEEYSENSENHEQVTLTYYSGDDTLADERDQPIDNTGYTVGDDNLLRFGAGSHDPNVVYIRNERLSMDFEVLKSRGKYAKEVLGIDTPDETLRHSRHPNRNVNRRAPRKFRGNDE